MIALTFAAVATANTFNFNITGKTSLPSYKGDADIQGSVKLVFDGTKVKVEYDLTNLEEAQCTEAKNACGIHIHKGTTCDDPQDHFWTNTTTVTKDPWTVIAYKREAASNSTTSKAASPSFEVGYNGTEAVGRVFVVHDKDGNKAACTVIPKPEERIMPKFSHTEEKTVEIGVSGEVTIAIYNANLLVRSLSEGKLELTTTLKEEGQSPKKNILPDSGLNSTKYDMIIDGTPLTITTEPNSTVWKFLFGNDSAHLTITVLSNDCSSSADAAMTTTTTNDSPTATKTKTTTSRPPTTDDDNEEKDDDEDDDEDEKGDADSKETDEEEGDHKGEEKSGIHSEEKDDADKKDEGHESCDKGYICHASLKSCQLKSLSASINAAGITGRNSNAVQNSSCMIFTVMASYFML